MDNLPLIVEIKRGSREDGPGIRSVVFFKGCPLRCTFCHSPETQDPGIEIAFSARECLQCGRCVEACSLGAIDLDRPGRIDRDTCTRCGRCAEVCPARALRRIGQSYDVETLVEILMRDRAFYRHSHGGITLSGGECTLYADYLEVLLRELKARRLHLALETCGYFNFDIFKEKILPYVDLIYYDVKIADPAAHREYTGKTNERIVDNLRRLIAERSTIVCPRIPLVPEITATRRNISDIVRLLDEIGAENVSLLPYNPMGMEMWAALGRPKPRLSERFMTPEEEKNIQSMFEAILKERRNGADRHSGGVCGQHVLPRPG